MAIKPIEIIIKAKDEASSIFSSMGAKVASVGVAIAGYFGISAFAGAVKGAADLEAKLSEVKAVSGATAAEMVLLKQAAEAAGASTKFTATEAAEALGNLSRSGLSAKDSIAALPAVLQLAQAGGIGLGEASEYITKSVMGMGLAFTDAGRVADVLAKGANASNTSVTGLAQALSYTAPVATSLGLSLETTVAIIGKFADAGIDASRAGTALNAILSQFSDPASKFRSELAAAGITTTNFEKALHQLAAAGPAGQKAVLAVGTEAGPALRALLNQGIGALDDLKSKLDNAAGSAAATAKVMEDNLNGAFNGLSSAWDTVKNTLATPVLPVLKDGVDRLSEALRSAVSDGTIGKFGDAIATAFQGGLKWAREFLGSVDFVALTTRMQNFATEAQAAFTRMGEYATNAGNVVKLVYGVMSSGVSAVMTVVYGLGEAFSGVASNIQSGLALLLDGLAKITFGGVSESFKKAADEVRISAGATWAASEAFAEKGRQAFIAMGDGAEMARDGWAGLTTDTQAASAAASASAPAFKSMADNLVSVGNAAAEAGTKAKDSGDKQQAAAVAAKEKVATLRAEYEAAVATGNWQLAAEKLQALKTTADGAKIGTAALKKQAEEDAAAIAASFERMGIKTKAELATFATTAKADFESIKASGQASTEGLQAAFKKYAEAAIAANGGVATAAVKAQAAMNGVSIETDNTGKSIVKAMEGGAKSIKTVEDAYHQLGLKTPEDLRKIADTNKAVWDKISGDSTASVATLKVAFTAYAQAAINASGDVGSASRQVTQEVLKEEAAVKGLTISFDENGKMVVKSQGDAGDAIKKVTSALEDQNAEMEAQVSIQEKSLALADRKRIADNKANRRDENGWATDVNGKRIESFVPSPLAVYNQAKSAGASEELALKIGEDFGIEVGRTSGSNIKQFNPNGLAKAIDEGVMREKSMALANPGNKPTGMGGATTPVSGVDKSAEPLQTSAKTYTVNIVTDGRSRQYTASSDADAQALIRQLQTSKLSSGI